MRAQINDFTEIQSCFICFYKCFGDKIKIFFMRLHWKYCRFPLLAHQTVVWMGYYYTVAAVAKAMKLKLCTGILNGSEGHLWKFGGVLTIWAQITGEKGVFLDLVIFLR